MDDNAIIPAIPLGFHYCFIYRSLSSSLFHPLVAHRSTDNYQRCPGMTCLQTMPFDRFFPLVVRALVGSIPRLSLNIYPYQHQSKVNRPGSGSIRSSNLISLPRIYAIAPYSSITCSLFLVHSYFFLSFYLLGGSVVVVEEINSYGQETMST